MAEEAEGGATGALSTGAVEVFAAGVLLFLLLDDDGGLAATASAMRSGASINPRP
jgi:hypothetical protein